MEKMKRVDLHSKYYESGTWPDVQILQIAYELEYCITFNFI